MTACVLQNDGTLNTVMCKGHSGTDDICTAVSTLMYTLAGWLRNTDHATIVSIELKPGDAEIVFRGGRDCYEMTKIGLLQLEHTAPDFIKVKVL